MPRVAKKPVVEESMAPAFAFNFTKLDADGNHLPAPSKKHVAVLDNTTGLIWAVETIGHASSWTHAKDMAGAVDLMGHKDWRLPTVRELLSIVDYSRRDPAIDVSHFPGTKTDDWYWSATPIAGNSDDAWGVGNSDDAWGVYFSYGRCSWGGVNGNGFVRAVRSARPGQ